MIKRKLTGKKRASNDENSSKNEVMRKEPIFMKPFRIPFFGAANVWKTSIIKTFLTEPYSDEYIPTIEDYYRKYMEYKGKQFQLDITDTGGSESFTAMRRLEIERADIIVLVYSLRNPESFEALRPIRDDIAKIHGDSKPVIVVASKSDLDVQGKNIEYMTSRGEMINTKKVVEKEWNYLWVITSARMKWGIDMIFHSVLNEFLKRRYAALAELQSVVENIPNFKF